MRISNLDYLVCPKTKEKLEIEILKQDGDEIKQGQLISKKSKLVYQIENGLVDFAYPEELKSSDKEFNDKYQESAASYDIGMEWLFSSFFETEDSVRNQLVSLLKLKKSDFVLNMGCGSGSDSPYILKYLDDKGKLFHADLSGNLLHIAKKKLAPPAKNNLEYFISNGSYLPFASQTFDAVFHFGGINIFSEKQKAIQEMTRVTKVGGRVVFGDESVAPWLSKKLYGKVLKNANPLYKHTPPIHLLPSNAKEVSLHYVLGNAFYAIAFTVGEPVQLNLDLPIPGKRGGTLRSRYEANFGKIKTN
jgi:ubiquinone/menaquinone biosynthesis C-methylase UbiE/uncharacterized protein YbaR (Trm112 family)